MPIVQSCVYISEACIYAFYSIAEHIDTYETTYIPKFIEVLTKIPYDKMNEKLLGTALDSIGTNWPDWPFLIQLNSIQTQSFFFSKCRCIQRVVQGESDIHSVCHSTSGGRFEFITDIASDTWTEGFMPRVPIATERLFRAAFASMPAGNRAGSPEEFRVRETDVQHRQTDEHVTAGDDAAVARHGRVAML